MTFLNIFFKDSTKLFTRLAAILTFLLTLGASCKDFLINHNIIAFDGENIVCPSLASYLWLIIAIMIGSILTLLMLGYLYFFKGLDVNQDWLYILLYTALVSTTVLGLARPTSILLFVFYLCFLYFCLWFLYKFLYLTFKE